MNRWTRISEDTFALPWSKRTPWSGLEAAVAVAVALIVGQLSGHESAGAIAAGAAFTIGFAVYHEALSSTLLSMLLLTTGLAAATLLGSLAAQWTAMTLLLTVVAAVNYGLLAGVGATPGWIGQQCGVYVVIAGYFPRGVHYAAGRAGMVIVGGLLQMVVFTISRLWHSQQSRANVFGPELVKRFGARTAEVWQHLHEEAAPVPGNETFPYIVRLSVTLLLSTALYRREHLANGYWAPMTALLVLKPQWAHTLSRGIARLVGTLVGAGFAVFMASLHPLSQLWVFCLVVVCAWACYALQAVNYALFCLALTLYVVFSFRFGGFSRPGAAHLRLFNTALGGGIALAVDAIWQVLAPRLGRRSVREAVSA